MSKTGVTVDIIGQDGNAFMILGIASKALKRAGKYDEFWNDYHTEATSGDYNHLLATTMKYFEIGGFSANNEDEESNSCERCGYEIDVWYTLCNDCEDEMEED